MTIIESNDKLNIVAEIDLAEPKIARNIELAAGLIALLIAIVFGNILVSHGYNQWLLIWIVLLLIPGIFLHEVSHYIFQWFFSRKKPQMGIKLPFPYSVLSPKATITRNQAIVCALAPLILISTILSAVASTFTEPISTVIYGYVSIHMATCWGDLLLIRWLLKYPKETKLVNINLRNVLVKL